jgi:hypothetical protein
LHWRSFLVKLGTDNLSGAHNEELFVASHKYGNTIIIYQYLTSFSIHVCFSSSHVTCTLNENLSSVSTMETGGYFFILNLVSSGRSVFVVYTAIGDISIFVVGKDEYDELACKYSYLF